MEKFLKALLSVTIILCPLYIIRSRFIIPTTLLEILILICGIVTLTVFLKSKEDFRILKTGFNRYIALFLAAAVLSTITSFNPIGGLGILKAYFLEPVLFYFCLIYVVKKFGDGFFAKKEGPSFILNSLLVTAIWLSILGLLQKLTGSYSLAPNEIVQGRISGVYNSANSLALFIGPVIFISGAIFLKSKGRFKLLYLSLFVFFTLIMLWTKSRGGLIAEIFATAVFIYTLYSQKIAFLRRVWKLVPVLIVLIISATLFQTVRTYSTIAQNRYYYQGSDTLEIRYYLWEGTINMLKDNPLLGAGLDGFKTLYAQKYKLPQYPEDFQYPHDLILTFWTEMGLFGLVVFLMIVIRSYVLLIKNLKKDDYLGAGLIAALTYWMVHGVVDVPYFKNDLSLEFWILIALVELHTNRLLSKRLNS